MDEGGSFRRYTREWASRLGRSRSGEGRVSSDAGTSARKPSAVILKLLAVIAGIVVGLFLVASLIATVVRILG